MSSVWIAAVSRGIVLSRMLVAFDVATRIDHFALALMIVNVLLIESAKARNTYYEPVRRR